MGPAKNLAPPRLQGNIEFGTFLDRLNDLERRLAALEDELSHGWFVSDELVRQDIEEGAPSYEAIAGQERPLGQATRREEPEDERGWRKDELMARVGHIPTPRAGNGIVGEVLWQGPDEGDFKSDTLVGCTVCGKTWFRYNYPACPACGSSSQKEL